MSQSFGESGAPFVVDEVEGPPDPADPSDDYVSNEDDYVDWLDSYYWPPEVE